MFVLHGRKLARTDPSIVNWKAFSDFKLAFDVAAEPAIIMYCHCSCRHCIRGHGASCCCCCWVSCCCLLLLLLLLLFLLFFQPCVDCCC